ncbi:macrophage migration inhibitory factor family protein [Hydrocoleum sp. CS-953]|uniref:phenylpyruvate tautomerase MIF-related protein n=1 Tax=Hydrocoleum sp. CS-953 TaxID=1671698 RepID=UPI000B9A546F|nr:phenylpyruvate tautomerase MIF-related protein [Hydrocoleum sp. CS-953]OZH54343.1 macrophage migration inhibitory factor family protein [Hydrocoleum sp. CS-953]
MPLIKVKTSVSKPEKDQIDTLLKSLSSGMAKHFSKSESYVMTIFESDIPMTFGGNSNEPVCYMEIKSIGSMNPNQTKAISQDFCQQINQVLGIPTNRIYIEFSDAKGSMWGWNSSTFG